jgi:hypothetical protein
MARLGWFVLILVVYVLHQDVWLWREARPLVFGFLPIGLAYHGAYCFAVAALMWLLTRFEWPAHLEAASANNDRRGGRGGADSGDPPR